MILSSSIILLAILACVDGNEFKKTSSVILRGGDIESGIVLKYDAGYIRGPGSIDLGNLSFHSDSEKNLNAAVDIAIISIPNVECLHQDTFAASRDNGCDWDQLGIGFLMESSSDSVEFCCTAEAFQNGLCEEQQYGRLITADHVQRRSVKIPTFRTPIPYLTLAPDERIVDVPESGFYGIVYAYCGGGTPSSISDDQVETIARKTSQSIEMTGKAVWKSSHGYLPGELYGFMNLYACMNVAYMILVVWLLCNTRSNVSGESNKYWIMSAVVAGLLEIICRTIDFYYWNSTGTRSNYIIWLGVILCIFKEGLTRCVAVLVLLESKEKRNIMACIDLRAVTIVLCCIFYIGTSLIVNVLTIIAVNFTDSLTTSQLTVLLDVIEIFGPYLKLFLDWCLAVVGVYSLFNIKATVATTIKGYVHNNTNERFVHYRILYSIIFIMTSVVYILSRMDHHVGGIIAVKHAWAKDAAYEDLYLIFLTGITSICWYFDEKDSEETQNMSLHETLLPLHALVDDNEDEPVSMNA